MSSMQNLNPYMVPDSVLWTGNFLKDINIDFKIGSSELIIYDEQSIESMLSNIWLTLKGERPFEPTFGSNIPALLWEPCDNITADYIETEIFDSTMQWMPYINIDYRNTSVSAFPDYNLYYVKIAYIHLISGLKRNFTLNLVR